ncbi:hypothetical protein [Allocoleopsis sp.]|uniref:hypothetical protein n=1 Tax=Allocoleopsis sp. TaxID=3088169 RepID=UPI002FD3CEBB
MLLAALRPLCAKSAPLRYRDLHFYQKEQIKRVRVVRRADGYYVQFSIDQERKE